MFPSTGCIGYQDVYVDERARSTSTRSSSTRTWETLGWPRTVVKKVSHKYRKGYFRARIPLPPPRKKIKPGAKLTSDSSGPWSKENNFGKSFRESFRGFHAAREIARATLSYFSRRDNILFTSSVPPSGIAWSFFVSYCASWTHLFFFS